MSVPGLTATEWAAYFDALNTNRTVRTEIRVLTLSHSLVSVVTPSVLDGQVDYIPGDGAARVLKVGFVDPDRTLRLDGDAPSSGFAGLNRLVQVRQSVLVPALGKWVSVYVFTGRPSSVERDGDTVTVEAQDKASLHLNTIAGGHLPKGRNTIAGIRALLTLNGETRFRFPSGYKFRLPANVLYGGSDEKRQPWLVARRLAKSINMQLYYDGEGYACLRKLPKTQAWTIREQGEGANILSRIKDSADLTTIRNKVIVTGHTQASKRVRSRKLVKVIDAATSHPFSPSSLRVNGHGWVNGAYYDEPTLRTIAQVITFGRARLTELLTEAVVVQTTAIPVWHLEPGDSIRVEARSASFNFRFYEGSVPLGPDDLGMTLGYTHRVRSASAGRFRSAA